MARKIKIVVDENIPFMDGVFDEYADVVFKNGSSICRDDVMDADALIIRTRTKCNAALLEGTRVTMISTATIGTDHIDLDYCASRSIEVHNASGCNAGGVMQYVFSSLYGVCSRNAISLQDKTIGIIGVGNVGKKVETMARYLGFKVLLCDPPRAEAEGSDAFVDQDTLLENSDVVTMHVPLLETTRGMADEDFFFKMKSGAVFINAARGEVVNEQALKAARPKLGGLIIDTWNHEPNVDRELVEMADVATPHIAGYSYQGKMNGTAMAVRAVARRFGIYQLYNFYPSRLPEDAPQKLDLEGKNQGQIAAVFQYNYPIFTDDFMFRMAPENFEKMRENYYFRKEIYV